MASRVRKIQPAEDGTPCIECGEKVNISDEFHYIKVSKMSSGIWSHKGYNFIHKGCYEKLLNQKRLKEKHNA